MKLGVMQPYFMPYIGYYQLISAVDVFVVYDKIKYTKKGWINRNRLLQNGKDAMFSLPISYGSDMLDINERELAVDFRRNKLINQFEGAYRRAPFFAQTFPLIEEIVHCEESNLFQFLHNSIVKTCLHLGITTQIRVSSEAVIDPALKSAERVYALCKAFGATAYVNSVGGVALYSKCAFQERGLDLRFIRSRPLDYMQLGDPFVPWLSIIDVMMFNSVNTIQTHMLENYETI